MTTSPEDSPGGFGRQLEILIELKTMLTQLVKDNDDHEKRLRRLEEARFPWEKVASMSTVSGAVIGFITWYATTH